MTPLIARLLLPTLIAIGLAACSGSSNDPVEEAIPNISAIAEEYLFLELSMGNIDAAHVDAYFGPQEIKARADGAALRSDEIRKQAAALSHSLATIEAPDEVVQSRLDGLQSRLTALDARIAINDGDYALFDDETEALFGTRAPQHDAEYFEAILAEIEAFLPGEGTLDSRVDEFRSQFVIPPEKLAAVFDAAIAECRRRTLEHIELADGESFTVEYVNDKPWSGYNWYQGNSVSLIQVNTDLPIFISRAVDLGCHEGYPGHHTYNALLEQNLVDQRGWLEFTLYPLFSPQSVIAEGSGNYGIKLAFPGADRAAYEKDVLFPLAGLDAAEADRYYELEDLIAKLGFAGNEAGRAYLNGEFTREEAIAWLTKYALMSPARAEQRTRFLDTYRSYVINYNHGQALVKDYIETAAASPEERWKLFESLLSKPVLPVDLE